MKWFSIRILTDGLHSTLYCICGKYNLPKITPTHFTIYLHNYCFLILSIFYIFVLQCVKMQACICMYTNDDAVRVYHRRAQIVGRQLLW